MAKAEVINAKAIRFTDTDNEEYTVEKYLGSGTEKIKMESVKNISKKIKFKDLGSWEQIVLPENINGLSIEQYDGKLEYFVKISDKGYGTEIDFKAFNVLLAALKAVANAKEQDNDKSKETKEKK